MSMEEPTTTDETNEITPDDVAAGDTVTLKFKRKATRFNPPENVRYTTKVLKVEGISIHMEHIYDEMDGKLVLDTSHNELYHRENGHKDTSMGNFAWIESIEN